MASEDITFCFNRKCNILKCIRNPKHIKASHGKPYHSFAFLEGTEDCLKAGEQNERNKTS